MMFSKLSRNWSKQKVPTELGFSGAIRIYASRLKMLVSLYLLTAAILMALIILYLSIRTILSSMGILLMAIAFAINICYVLWSYFRIKGLHKENEELLSKVRELINRVYLDEED